MLSRLYSITTELPTRARPAHGGTDTQLLSKKGPRDNRDRYGPIIRSCRLRREQVFGRERELGARRADRVSHAP
jgi:hypothetical protein